MSHEIDDGGSKRDAFPPRATLPPPHSSSLALARLRAHLACASETHRATLFFLSVSFVKRRSRPRSFAEPMSAPSKPRASALTLGLRRPSDDVEDNVVIPPAADSPRSPRVDFGSSSHGRHGRERADDDGFGRSFGRQHGSSEMLNILAEHEAQSIPIRNGFSVHAGEYSGSYVRAADGSFVPKYPSGSPRVSSSPRVVVVHSAVVDFDSGSIGLAGRRNRGSFNSLIMLEANDLAKTAPQ